MNQKCLKMQQALEQLQEMSEQIREMIRPDFGGNIMMNKTIKAWSMVTKAENALADMISEAQHEGLWNEWAQITMNDMEPAYGQDE